MGIGGVVDAEDFRDNCGLPCRKCGGSAEPVSDPEGSVVSYRCREQGYHYERESRVRVRPRGRVNNKKRRI